MNDTSFRQGEEMRTADRGWDAETVRKIAAALGAQEAGSCDGAALEAAAALGALCARSNPVVAVQCLLGAARGLQDSEGRERACDLLLGVLVNSDPGVLPSELVDGLRKDRDGVVAGIADHVLALRLEEEDPQRSIALYEECIAHSPKNGKCCQSAMVWLANLVKDEDPDRAMALCEEVVGRTDDERLRSMAAVLTAWTADPNEPEEALPHCLRAIELADDEIRFAMLAERALPWFAVEELRPYALRIVAAVVEHAGEEASEAAAEMLGLFARVMEQEGRDDSAGV